MELSSRVRYSLLALLELARHHEQEDFLQIDQIAASHQIPERYLAQLLMGLRRCGLVRSQRGAKGGYLLAKSPWQITVGEVLACLEGSKYLKPEAQTGFATPESAAIDEVWQEATTAALKVLQRHTLQDLCDKRDENQQSNITYQI
jgi:Rrf2 family transcriptional regulator, cysteine metabolism repressor